jgi:hypothetical protein
VANCWSSCIMIMDGKQACQRRGEALVPRGPATLPAVQLTEGQQRHGCELHLKRVTRYFNPLSHRAMRWSPAPRVQGGHFVTIDRGQPLGPAGRCTTQGGSP